MASKPVSDAELLKTLRARQRLGTNIAVAEELGIFESTVRRRLKMARERRVGVAGAGFSVQNIPPEHIPIEELVEQRIKKNDQLRKYYDARRLIDIAIGTQGPFALFIVGDPHVDDDHTDMGLLRDHLEMTREAEACYRICIGDCANAWVGRLRTLYAHQSTSESEAVQLLEWFIERGTPWLLTVGGNHDAWWGTNNPVRWFQRAPSGPYLDHDARFRLLLPDGSSIRVNARHDHPGHSQYDPGGHGPAKSIYWGARDHLAIAGHRHTCGYRPLQFPAESGEQIVCHALRVGSYKRPSDPYPRAKGMKDNNWSPCAMVVIDPSLSDEHADKLKVFWSPERGLDYLRHLRE